jgi:hypothetical protein
MHEAANRSGHHSLMPEGKSLREEKNVRRKIFVPVFAVTKVLGTAWFYSDACDFLLDIVFQ